MKYKISTFQTKFIDWWLKYLRWMSLPSDECHWILLMVSWHWPRQWLWLGVVMQQVITWANADSDRCHMASLGYSELVFLGALFHMANWVLLYIVILFQELAYLSYSSTMMNTADSRFAPSQLQNNAVSHWLGANLQSALMNMINNM